MLHPNNGYHFQVEWGGQSMNFLEVSGLSIEHEVIEYRDGNSKVMSAQKIPGMTKFSNITLKRGIIPGDNEMYQWMISVHGPQVERRDVLIKLLNNEHNPTLTWRARNAWPCKLYYSTLNASGNEVAVETIELAHEGLEIVQ